MSNESVVPQPAPRPSALRRSRTVERVSTARPATDGAGVKLFRNQDPAFQQRLDPFLMLDEFGSDSADDYVAGFPDHPHRGFETVTYMLAGSMRHKDSAGHGGVVTTGGVQWMKAARGVIHSEMPAQEAGLMRGFQLWLNLPAAEKMDAPWYDDIPAARIPTTTLPNGTRATVIAGELFGVRGPAPERKTVPIYVDLQVPAQTTVEVPLPSGHYAFAYVYEGSVALGPGDHAKTVSMRQLAVLGNEHDADGLRGTTDSQPARLLVLAGHPLHEPVAQYGPFVMNTKEEIAQAFADYQSGRLGR